MVQAIASDSFVKGKKTHKKTDGMRSYWFCTVDTYFAIMFIKVFFTRGFVRYSSQPAFIAFCLSWGWVYADWIMTGIFGQIALII